ncbi:MAG TPA: carbohydrate ABC transporter permease [Acidimicrobiales bacterium]|nr:carbohydrate ABC transporter permease [Acidimicrobiales bacterium]
MSTATISTHVAATARPGPRPTLSRRPGFYVYLAAGAALALLFVLPLLWVIVRSLEPPVLSTEAPQAADFTHLTVSNYSALLGPAEDVLVNVGNSLIAGLGTAALTVVACTLAGYGLSRFRFRGAGVVFGAILLALMIPFQAVLTPLFLELHFLHLLNSLLGLVLIYSTFNLPFGVFVMRNTFLQVPRELVDSARVDGAGVLTSLVRVMRPLVVPGMATTAIYAFLYSWNELLQALTFLTSDNLMTLPVKLYNVETSTYGAINFGYLSSGVVIAMVPCVVLYLALQRYYIRGLTSGALKG